MSLTSAIAVDVFRKNKLSLTASGFRDEASAAHCKPNFVAFTVTVNEWNFVAYTKSQLMNVIF